MAIILQEVKTKWQQYKFAKFGNDDPSYDVCESVQYLAYRDGQIVGRVAGIINRVANERWGVKKVRFGWIDFIDDYEVSRALLDAVAAWGKSKGMNQLNGPVGFTDWDYEGLLIEGFEYLAPMASLYNFPYYEKHMEAYGLTERLDRDPDHRPAMRYAGTCTAYRQTRARTLSPARGQSALSQGTGAQIWHGVHGYAR